MTHQSCHKNQTCTMVSETLVTADIQHQMAPPERVQDQHHGHKQMQQHQKSPPPGHQRLPCSIVKCTYNRAWSTCPTWSRGYSNLHGGLNMAKFM